MDVDLTGGIEPSKDFFFPAAPDDPQARESVSPAEGRAVVLGLDEGRSPVDEDRICRTFTAGALEVRVLEPFETLAMAYDGPAVDTRAEVLATGDFSGPEVRLRIEVQVTCAAPPGCRGR